MDDHDLTSFPDEKAVQPSSSQAVRLLAEHSLRSNTKDTESSKGHGAGTRPARGDRTNRPFYTCAQWTADGTSLVATSSANVVSSFVLPTDLLHPAGGVVRQLQPQATIRLPEPAQAVAPAPYFSLGDPTSQTLLAGCRDHPIQLFHLFPAPPQDDDDDDADNDDNESNGSGSGGGYGTHAAPLASYKLMRKETEQYITPASLVWDAPGSHFVCGSANRLDCFDSSRPGSDGPLLTIPTIPSRRHISKGNGVGMKGTVSALASSPSVAGHAGSSSSVLAAGTRTRWMGLYDLHRTDRAVANWCVASAAREAFHVSSLGGQGVVQAIWSPCGRYLVVNERQAEGLLVYDVRVTGRLLSVLRGRTAATQQRLRCDVFAGDEEKGGGFELWAGRDDGAVAVWEAVGTRSGVLDPEWAWAAHDSPVGSAAIHPGGSVVATCSGGWGHPALEAENPLSSSRAFEESSLKVWCLE